MATNYNTEFTRLYKEHEAYLKHSELWDTLNPCEQYYLCRTFAEKQLRWMLAATKDNKLEHAEVNMKKFAEQVFSSGEKSMCDYYCVNENPDQYGNFEYVIQLKPILGNFTFRVGMIGEILQYLQYNLMLNECYTFEQVPVAVFVNGERFSWGFAVARCREIIINQSKQNHN